ncbi:MAG: hypothetical protein HYZ50_16845 [Deltaproteobacteria bacterium]|nr:hypothetical protein [Deltaproteobacteria bacterium]
MKNNRHGVKRLLLGLIVGGIGVLLMLPILLSSSLLFNRGAGTASSSQTSTPNANEPSVQELLETTYLGRAEEYPDPGESAMVLRKYVGRDTHKYLEEESEQRENLDQEIAEWEILVAEHPQSRHALARLAELYRNKAELTQDKSWFRKAADHYIQAAEIGLSHGRIRYTRELSELLVELNDKTKLDGVFEIILAQPRDEDRDHYYRALVDYGDGLAWMNDEQRAWGYFKDAVDFHPEQNAEAINRYARHLLDRGYAQQAFDILDSRLTSEARAIYVMPAYLRKEAMKFLGMDTDSAEAETIMVKQRVIENGGSTAVILSDAGANTNARGTGFLETLFTPAAEAFVHSRQSDDCRDRGWQYSLCDSFGNCFTPNAINLAEIIYNEAQGEKQGARYSVGWTVKNRAFQALNPQCDSYPGGIDWGNLPLCFQGIPCNDPNFCDQSKRVCCALHGGTTLYNSNQLQFNDGHRSFNTLVSSGAIYAAWYILDGFVPDISTGWIPPGVSGCNSLGNANACGPVGIPVDSYGLPAAPASAGPWCQYGSNFFDPNPNGPMEFRGCIYTAQASSCKWPARDVCGNSTTDYVCSSPPNPLPPSDNYFWNRKGPSLAVPIGYFDVITSDYVAYGWALDADVPLASIDIHVYIDGPAGGGTFVAGFPANQPRADVNQVTGYPGNHGWSWVIPAQYRAAPHTYYAYALDQTGTYNPQLSLSPRTR